MDGFFTENLPKITRIVIIFLSSLYFLFTTRIITMIDRINSIVQSAFITTLFKWGNLIMIYGSFFLPVGLYFTNDHKIFGSIAWIFLIVIMAVRPLSGLFPNFRLFRKILVIRRSLGILSGMAALTHGIGFFYAYPSEIGASYLLAPNLMFLYGIIALVFSTLLLITSNNFSVKLL